MIGELERRPVRWVVRDGSFDRLSEPNGSSRSSGVFLLDRYLQAHFRPVVDYDDVQIWLRRDLAAPPRPPKDRCI